MRTRKASHLRIFRWTVTAAVIAAWVVFLAAGCTTTRVTEDARAVVVGRVYDENGVPLANVNIQSGRFRAVTDNRGRFRMEAVPFGIRRLTATAARHEQTTAEVALASPFVVAHITLWSITGLIDQAILYISRGVPAEAHRAYRRARAIDSTDDRVFLLGEIVGADR